MATYSYLSEELRPSADKVYAHLRDRMGLKAIQVESVDFEASPAPTFCGETRNKFKICVEVNYSFFPNTLNEFVVDCLRNGFPVKLYSAVPANPNNTIDQTSIQRAGKLGVGCFLIESGKITVLREAQDLSLLLTEDERDLTKIPSKFRAELYTAISTYEGGDPKKGVSNIFDLIEGIIRNIAIRAKRNGAIPSSNNLDLKRDAWVAVMKAMQRHNVLDDVFLSRCIGSSHARNFTSHPPKNFTQWLNMHKRLRTNYNLSMDVLRDLLIEAKAKGYRV